MTGLAYLATGFAVIWAILAGYLFWIGRQQVSLERRMAELESLAEGDAGTSGTGGVGRPVTGSAVADDIEGPDPLR
jgi:CcmD family protein